MRRRAGRVALFKVELPSTGHPFRERSPAFYPTGTGRTGSTPRTDFNTLMALTLDRLPRDWAIQWTLESFIRVKIKTFQTGNAILCGPSL
jgi:hypothetical protein